MFLVEYDRAANCLNVTVKGFFQPQDVAPLSRDVEAKAKAARAIRDDFDVVVESTEFPVQANDVADLMTSIMRMGMAMTNGRAAVVVGSVLNKAQAERTLVHDRLRVFMDMNAAREWLKQPG